MRRFATFWALAGSWLMLCLLTGTAEPGKDGKALRNQRARSTRATRLDADHEAYDHSGDLLTGATTANLSWQASPVQPPPAALPAATQSLPGFTDWEPVSSVLPFPYRSFLVATSPGRSPPSLLL